MGAVYKSICNEADTFMLLVAKLAEKEIRLKLDIENLMNRGFINIAKARYIMGSTCVTKMQLPTENSNPIQPLATVSRTEIDDSWVFNIRRRSCSKNSESISEIHMGGGENSEIDYTSSKTSLDSCEKSKAEFVNILQSDPKSLKKSKNAFLIEDNLYQSYNDEYLDKLSNSDSSESLVSVTDPIRLFGILVPNAMKEAQVIFNEVVDLLGECATVQCELHRALNKFHHLEKVKGLIEAASKDMKLNILVPKVYWTPSGPSTVSCSSEETEESEEVSVTKSIRSVFYDLNKVSLEEDSDKNREQEAEYSVWSSENGDNEGNNQ